MQRSGPECGEWDWEWSVTNLPLLTAQNTYNLQVKATRECLELSITFFEILQTFSMCENVQSEIEVSR